MQESEIHKISNEKEQKRTKVPQANIVSKKFLKLFSLYKADLNVNRFANSFWTL
jgi:hypothetical protein